MREAADGTGWVDRDEEFESAVHAAVDAACASLYAALERAGIETLYDDSDTRAGAKFATMDLIGLPWQLIVGPKSLAEGKVELKRRATGEREVLPIAAALERLGVAAE